MSTLVTTNKRAIRKELNHIAIGIIIYQIILFLYIIIDMIVCACIKASTTSSDFETILDNSLVILESDKFMEEYTQLGTSSIIACIIATIFLFIFSKKKNGRK